MIAEHCAKLWAQSQALDLTLVGRDAGRIERVAADIKARSAQSIIRILQAEFIDPAAIRDTVNGIVAQGKVDIVLIAHGSLPEQAICQDDLKIAIIGSVAGDRGRKSNYVYGAAKGLVTCYVQGLQHRLADTGVRIVLIKPGPTDTPMTANLKGKGAKLAPVEGVAKQIVDGVETGKPIIYAPGKWWLIMMIIRHLPLFVFNKMNI